MRASREVRDVNERSQVIDSSVRERVVIFSVASTGKDIGSNSSLSVCIESAVKLDLHARIQPKAAAPRSSGEEIDRELRDENRGECVALETRLIPRCKWMRVLALFSSTRQR